MIKPIQAFEKHLKIDESGQSIIAVLSENCPQVSKQKLKQAMQFGAVWLTRDNKTNRVRRAKKDLQMGDEVHLYYDPSILFDDIKPALLIQDEVEYSVWNKPCGMFSQGTKWADHSSITRWVELFGLKTNELGERPVFLVHRLDRATSGLILVAHSKKMTTQLSRLFEDRKIEKHYKAVVNGKFPKEKMLQPIESPIDGREAITLVLSADFSPQKNQSSLLVQIKTGRKHQIRKHLLEIGFPIIGDRLYGKNDEAINQQIDLQLTSCFLEFDCPLTAEKKSYQL